MPENNNPRLLAAIMFADMVGYTRLMQENEHKARVLRDHQRAVVNEKIPKHRGQVIQYYGDGTLSMFGSAIEAVNAAQEIQLTLQEDPKVPLRVGIHLGDIVIDSEGIYGDAVNLAARVQALGTPGSVMISGKVFDEIKNHPKIRVKAFGEHELKNVFQMTSIFALASKGLQVPDQHHIQELTGSYKNSVAVLPFVNFSGDPREEYFSDGITEEIINTVANASNLEVASRTSVFAYKQTNKDIRQIGKELNVATVLEGSVRKSGNRIRVTAQLINTDNGFHIWSENFDGGMKDIFEVQDEISLKIMEKLQANSFSNIPRKLYKASTDNVVAYNLYLEGLFYWNKRTPESVTKAIGIFKKAIKQCNTYANAFSGLANAYTFLGTIGQMDGRKAFENAEEYARQAINLDSSRSDSYTAFGCVNLLFRWDFNSAESNFRKAITLEPENEEARMAFAIHNRIIGRFDQMLIQAKAAVKIAPLSLPALDGLANAYMLMRNYEEALQLYDKIIGLDPKYRAAYKGKALMYIEMKDFKNAEKAVNKYVKLIKGQNTGESQVGYLAAMMGNIEEAKKNLKLMEKKQAEQPELNLSIDFAIIYAALGDADQVFKYLNQALEKRFAIILFINTIQPLAQFRDDPRYLELVEIIGFPNKSLI